MNAIYQKIKQKFLPKVLTLKFRLMLLITVVLLIVVGGPLYFLVYQLDKNYQEFSVDMIETTSQAVYQSVYEGFMQNDWESIQRNLELLSLEPNIEHLRIYRPSGEILYSSNPNEVNKNIFKLGDPVFQNPSDTAEQEAFKRVGNAYSHQHLIYVQKECLPCHANQGSIIGIMDVKVELSQSEYIYSSIKQLTIISAILIVVFLWIILNLL
ncbi:hypothetical protein GWN26_05135, partial [Candidatus Saccharibacteria bacterium]|nr:hypothetical protein [Candidatus Saccharibacteria bacterium]NIW78807.1 hypothetical protein [Calditrichia bacterium]